MSTTAQPNRRRGSLPAVLAAGLGALFFLAPATTAWPASARPISEAAPQLQIAESIPPLTRPWSWIPNRPPGDSLRFDGRGRTLGVAPVDAGAGVKAWRPRDDGPAPPPETPNETAAASSDPVAGLLCLFLSIPLFWLASRLAPPRLGQRV